MKYDICIIGSGAGAGPIAYELAKAGFQVLVLEKGPWFKTPDFKKDELVAARRAVYTPNLMDEQHVLESQNAEGEWEASSTYNTGNSFWSGNMVGGATNLMSGYFFRMKPDDFRPVSAYGKIPGSNAVDWPLSYPDMEPYFAKVEQEVGVSGRVVNHSMQEPRSTPDFPYPPLTENKVSGLLDDAAARLGYQLVPTPRAILSRTAHGRGGCSYSNYCGSYGCSTDAKGSSRAALLKYALQTGNCKVVPYSKVFKLEAGSDRRVHKAWLYDRNGSEQAVEAKLFVVAAQAIETARLLLMSKSKAFPDGLANNSGQVGKNLIFSAGGIGSGQLFYEDFSGQTARELAAPGLFVNRSLHEWYEIEDQEAFNGKTKGGTVDFLFEHANPIPRAASQKWDDEGKLVYGKALQQRLKHYFTRQRKLNFEIFLDWQPNDNCFVTLDDSVKDRWGDPVARIRTGHHPHDLKVGRYIAQKTERLLQELGARNVSSSISGAPPPNLVAGGCRFGNDPRTSVLDPTCKAHEVDNLYVTDGSFMPTGGSVPQSWTIYANAFRVADIMINRLKKSFSS